MDEDDGIDPVEMARRERELEALMEAQYAGETIREKRRRKLKTKLEGKLKKNEQSGKPSALEHTGSSLSNLFKNATHDQKVLRMIMKEAYTRGVPTHREQDEQSFGGGRRKYSPTNPYNI